jgi:hypothetical protein
VRPDRSDASTGICATRAGDSQFAPQFCAVLTDTACVIDSRGSRTTGAATAAMEDDTLLDASRWALWQTLARGLAHSLGNAAQLLTLEPPPGAVLAEARARVSRANALLALAGRPAEPAPAFLPAVLADFDALQRLQIGLPAAALELDVQDPLPPAAIAEADALHVLLLLVTRLKEASVSDTLGLRVRVRADAGFVRVKLSPGDLGDPIAPVAPMAPGVAAVPELPPGSRRAGASRPGLLEASAALLARSGGGLRESGAGWELGLPVTPRDGAPLRTIRG